MNTLPTTGSSSVQRQRKERMFAEFASDCANTEGLFVAVYTGLDVASLSELRLAAKAAGGRVRVVKNSIAKRVLAQTRFAPLVADLHGQLLYGIGVTAPALAKAFQDFAKDHEELVLRGGILDSTVLDADSVWRLANLPNRDQMLGILAGTLNAPIVKACPYFSRSAGVTCICCGRGSRC